jgi:homoserine kinase
VACGTAHADNVAPGLLGGFVLVRSYNPLDVIRIPSPDNLFCSLVHPHVEVKTADARKILRQQIALKDAIVQWGNIAGLVTGLMQRDFSLIGRSLTDVLIEPIRSMLIPAFDQAKEAAMKAGALGFSISGSGPTVFALSDSLDKAEKICEAITAAFTAVKLESEQYISGINKQGPRIIE